MAKTLLEKYQAAALEGASRVRGSRARAEPLPSRRTLLENVAEILDYESLFRRIATRVDRLAKVDDTLLYTVPLAPERDTLTALDLAQSEARAAADTAEAMFAIKLLGAPQPLDRLFRVRPRTSPHVRAYVVHARAALPSDVDKVTDSALRRAGFRGVLADIMIHSPPESCASFGMPDLGYAVTSQFLYVLAVSYNQDDDGASLTVDIKVGVVGGA